MIEESTLPIQTTLKENCYPGKVKTLEPSFDVPVVNVTATAGNLAILPCSVNRLGDHKVSWSDPREKTLTLSDRRVIADDRISIERPFTHDWNLYIRNVVPSDAGKYMCTINTNPVKIKYIMLYIQEPPTIIDALSSSGITAREGDTVQLICNATGVPIPTVTWYRRSSGSKTELKEVVGSNGEVLLIHNISRYCDDLYECVAYNDIQPAASREMRVVVEFPPEIHLPTKRIGQVPGKETILECRISSNPKVYSAWKKNGYEIDSNLGRKEMRRKYRVELYEDDKYTITLSLRIMSIEAEDYGAYTCVSRNELGSDSEEMILYEYIEHTPAPPTSRPSVTYKTVTSIWAPRETGTTRPEKNTHHHEQQQPPQRNPNRQQDHKYNSIHENNYYYNQGSAGKSSLENNKAEHNRFNILLLIIILLFIKILR